MVAKLAEHRAQRPLVHSEAPDTLLTRLATNAAVGLTASEAQRRLVQDGPNVLPKPQGKSALARLLEQFANPIVLTLLVAAIIALIDGASRTGQSVAERFGDAIAILLIVAINAVLGFVQEQRAEAALAALETMQTPNARVRRDDAVGVVSAADLVAGDVLELEAGDAVPADARLLQTIGLYVEESSLTGESVPVAKDASAAVAGDAPLGDRVTMLFVGTNVVRGKARAVVVATGPRTELGHLSALIHEPRDRTTPLEQKLDAFGKRILWGCLGLSGILFARGMLRGDRSWHELLLEAVSLAVAAIPEGLPAITTITLALGMQRMAKNGAIIRKLAAVDTLGAATIICTDKTGTLTQNEMTVREIYAGKTRYRVTGSGYDPAGTIVDVERELANGDADGAVVASPDRPAQGTLGDLLATVALCNNATLQHREGRWLVQGDPTEGALLTLADKGGVSHEAITSSHQVLGELPFDGDRKRMTIVALDQAGREIAYSKGSADVLLRLCTDYDPGDRSRHPLDDEARRIILEEADRMSSEALRVLAVGQRDLGKRARTNADTASPGDVERELAHGDVERELAHGDVERELAHGDVERELAHGDVEQRLTFLGLVGMVDPPRPGVREAIARCAEAHVRAVMITGDHKLTAVAIAKELGLWTDRAIALTGTELEEMSDGSLQGCIEDVRVFARVTAEQKLRIVAAFKRCGHVVSMTGDGVNDAPALREAHIGVAMGKNGTDVAREAADMVIADDNFATIVEAVREGRAIWRNIQKFIFFLLSSNAGLLFAVFAVSFFTNLPPLTPLMILWINLVTNGLPALALGVDTPDPTQMREPPRRSSGALLDIRAWVAMAAVGIWMGGAAMVCYLAPFHPGDPLAGEHGRAIAFSLLALSPLFHAYNCRSARASIFSLRPVFPLALGGAVAISAGIHLIAVLVPTLRPVFKTFAMDSREWLWLLVLSVSIVPAVEVLKFFDRLLVAAEAPAPDADA